MLNPRHTAIAIAVLVGLLATGGCATSSTTSTPASPSSSSLLAKGNADEDGTAADPADPVDAADEVQEGDSPESGGEVADEPASADPSADEPEPLAEEPEPLADEPDVPVSEDEVSYELPADDGDWGLPPGVTTDGGPWDLPEDLLDDDFAGADVATQAQIEQWWAEWEALVEQWNREWAAELPTPTLPNERTTIEPRIDDDPKGVPTVSYTDDLKLAFESCPGGTATYVVKLDGQVVRSGPMTETSPGTFTGAAEATAPQSGAASVDIVVDCPAGQANARSGFDLYIDPAGTVVDQQGNLVVGARVVLFRADSKEGPYVVVPDGSSIMAPSNRRNPDITGKDGVFQWDVTKGWYLVRATADGCVSPSDSTVPFGQTDRLEVPPPRLGLVIRLACGPKATVVRTLKVAKQGLIRGKGKVGATLQATAPTTKATGSVAISWQRVGSGGGITPIQGAKGTSYKVSAADKGSSVRAVFTVTKRGYAPLTVTTKSIQVR
jgi:hypothetical protein